MSGLALLGVCGEAGEYPIKANIHTTVRLAHAGRTVGGSPATYRGIGEAAPILNDV